MAADEAALDEPTPREVARVVQAAGIGCLMAALVTAMVVTAGPAVGVEWSGHPTALLLLAGFGLFGAARGIVWVEQRTGGDPDAATADELVASEGAD